MSTCECKWLLTLTTYSVLTVFHLRHQFHESDDDVADEILGDEYITLQETLASVAAGLPAVQLPAELSKVFGQSANVSVENLDFKALVRLRREHQTRQAANCARIKRSDP